MAGSTEASCVPHATLAWVRPARSDKSAATPASITWTSAPTTRAKALALALPEDVRGLAAAVVVLQTLIELVAELAYVRLIPAVVWPTSR